MHHTTPPHLSSNPEQIAFAAFGLWEQAGRPDGRDQEFWFHAERLLATAATDPFASNGQETAKRPRTASGNSSLARMRGQAADATQTSKPATATLDAPRQRRTGTAGRKP